MVDADEFTGCVDVVSSRVTEHSPIGRVYVTEHSPIRPKAQIVFLKVCMASHFYDCSI